MLLPIPVGSNARFSYSAKIILGYLMNAKLSAALRILHFANLHINTDVSLSERRKFSINS